MNGGGAMELPVASVVHAFSNDLLKANSGPLLTADRFSHLVLMAFVTIYLAPVTLLFS
jgi:hypothetical protein